MVKKLPLVPLFKKSNWLLDSLCVLDFCFIPEGKQVLPDSIARLQKLEELDVSSNLLVSLPDSIGLLLNLKVLNISGNKINSLPEAISRCRLIPDIALHSLLSW